ncbi:MAG TPA: FHA domain-containing protein [Pirellulales bacterium]|nr:FHA domain-containing protein [Pirellulales bacterium]
MRLRVHSLERTFEWESSSAHFRVGRGDACDLRMEGKASQFASWEHAGFSVGDDGAMYVTDLGSSNGTYVDGVRISVATPLRVGSIVQLGRAGPKLEVLALNTAAPIPIPTAAPAPTPVDSAAAGPRLLTTLKGWPQRNWLIGAAVVVIAVIGFLAASRSPAPPAPPPVIELADTKDTNKRHEHKDDRRESNEDDAEPKVNPQDVNKSVEPKLKEAAEDREIPQTVPLPQAAPDPWKEAKERGMAAYRLIVVEDPVTQRTWPHAGAIVVGEHALLTTAGVAVDLQKIRDHKWLVTVMKPPHGPRVPIAETRVHTLFEQADPEK